MKISAARALAPLRLTMTCAALCLANGAQADAVQSLRNFVKDVHAGQTRFTQTVTSPDGRKARRSSGTLEFERPNRFRFAYQAPMEQLIVGDGKKVWLYDADLNQVTVRAMGQALGSSPAALLAGGNLDKDFILKPVPPASASVTGAATAGSSTVQAAGLIEWVEAQPRAKDGQFQWVRVGFTQGKLVALELLDSFGQKSRLDFAQFDTKVTLSPSRFTFTPPAGADVLQQP